MKHYTSIVLAFLLSIVASAGTAQAQSASPALAGPPSIAGLSIMGAPPEGGTIVLIVGLNLDSGATVTYDGVPAVTVSVCTTSLQAGSRS